MYPPKPGNRVERVPATLVTMALNEAFLGLLQPAAMSSGSRPVGMVSFLPQDSGGATEARGPTPSHLQQANLT